MNLTERPFRLDVADDGELRPATSTVRRRLSDMAGMYHDAEAERSALAADDPLVYEVFQYDMPAFAGELVVCTTVLRAGKVGDEFFMTKGHYHEQRDRAEVYYGLSGRGRLLLAKDGECEAVPMVPGGVAYVPPYWAHRTVNTGPEPLVFLAVYPGDAGHDYGTIETTGFPQIVLERAGEVTVAPNPARTR